MGWVGNSETENNGLITALDKLALQGGSQFKLNKCS